jgi:hypothetical protein
MRVLLVSPFPPSIGGVSVSVQRLYDFLVKSGFDVVRFDTQFRNKRLNSSKSLKFLKYLTLPFFILVIRRVDVIHFHVSGVFPKLYVSLWRWMFRRNTRFIITIHGEVSHLLKSSYGTYSLNSFDRIICVKKGDTEHMPAALRPRTVEIPAFIPPEMSDKKVAFPENLQKFLERDSFKLLLNGFIISDHKYNDLYGFRDSILLLEQLRIKRRNAELILVVLGSDYNHESRDYLASLKDYCFIKNLGEHVCWVENQVMELWPLMKKVDVLLRPTLSDGDALSIRESLYLHKPVITSNAVPRPSGSIVYKLNKPDDLLEKTLTLIDNYDEHVSRLGTHNFNFARKIADQYEIQ